MFTFRNHCACHPQLNDFFGYPNGIASWRPNFASESATVTGKVAHGLSRDTHTVFGIPNCSAAVIPNGVRTCRRSWSGWTTSERRFHLCYNKPEATSRQLCKNRRQLYHTCRSHCPERLSPSFKLTVLICTDRGGKFDHRRSSHYSAIANSTGPLRPGD
jgi:hypothetical protein